MAVTEIKNNINFDSSRVEFICPVCKSKKLLDVPNSVIAEAKQLTTMSIARGLVCDHQFQAFVDKQFQVRGYQRVDFEFENRRSREKNSNNEKNEDDFFKSIILEGNYVEYKPKKARNNVKTSRENNQNKSAKRKMSINEIYNEFWEFIDDNNEAFRDLICLDSRRTHIE